MNIPEFDPDFEAEAYGIGLEAIYNQHVGHTHHHALVKVFEAGMVHILLMKRFNIQESQSRYEELRAQFAALQQKYEALNAKFNVNQPGPDPATADETRRELVSQAIGMGKVFQCGYEQQN